MKRILLGLFLLPLMSFAQSTTVTATITDSDSFVWKNGSYQIQFVPNPAFPGGPYTWTGGTLVTLYQGTLNSSGILSVSLPDNLTITGPGTQWKFTICPYATGGNCFSVTTAVTGASESLTALLSAAAAGPRFSAAPSIYGYGTVEINTQAQPGWGFYNTTTGAGFQWSGSAWVATAGTGGPPTGAAGGDLGGTYPNPSVAQVNGAVVPLSAAYLASNSSRQLVAATSPIAANTIQASGSPFTVPATTGYYWNNTAGAYSFDLPVPVSGLQLCFGNYQARASAVSIIPSTGVTIYFKGVAGTISSATGLVSSGAAGDFICVVGTDATTYMAIGGGFGAWVNN